MNPCPADKVKTSLSSDKLLAALKNARPALYSLKTSEGQIPETVSNLQSWIMKNLDVGIIPSDLKSLIRKAESNNFESIPDYAFKSSVSTTERESNMLLTNVQTILCEALECGRWYKDENAWGKVVSHVWSAAKMTKEVGMLELVNIKNQSIDPKFLPVLPDGCRVKKKADFALQFSLGCNSEVPDELAKVKKCHPELALSQMQDAHTKETPLVCGIELKKQGGNSNEAFVQMSIWSSAGLQWLKEMCDDNESHDLPPFIGWTVVGHYWDLYIILKSTTGDTTSYGPIETFRTYNLYDIFKLVEAMTRIDDWLTEVYWPWLRDRVLIPKGNKG